ncbi:hypothetical protein K4F52_004171 [Lecanicillium sp. MT-2017a]|nr:hypothetical protein K4F52_004171 [Lecanicillium sp. MT-2017a]
MPQTARSRTALAATQPSAPSISSFTRVSKSTVLPDPAAKDVVVAASRATTTTSSRKRKASASFEGADDHDAGRLARRNVSFAPSDEEDDQQQHKQQPPPPGSRAKRSCRRSVAPSLPHPAAEPPKTTAAPAQTTKGKRTAKVPPSRKEAAHRRTASTVISKARAETRAGQAKIEAFYKKKQQQQDADNDEASFPPHLADLVRLHKAFLKTVVIQLAHSSSNVPLDVSTLSADISRSWGKRAVTIEDIRRCVAIQSSTGQEDKQSPFIVSDYGRGKVCVELRPGHDGAAINQPALCRQFADNLRALSSDRATNQMTDANVDVALEGLSLAELPQVAVTDMNTQAKTAALFSKGHQALSGLKSELAAKQQEKAAKQQSRATGTALLNPDGTKMSLLDRLRHKELAASSAPQPPTGPELQRRAALNRAADVAATISMLSLSNPVSLPRQAFTMAVMAEKVRDSLRVPVSKEEGIACIKLIAAEVAPEWLRIVAIGGRENVVIQRGGEPVNRVIQERVQKLLG